MPTIKDLMRKEGVEDSFKEKIIRQGHNQDIVDEALRKLKQPNPSKYFSVKEIFNRIGFGFSNHQFLNILFYNMGASVFLVGLINGLRAILSMFFSSFMREYNKRKTFSKKFISSAGIIYGFSFLFIAYAFAIKSRLFFALALLIGSIGVVAHGDAYMEFVRNSLKKEKMAHFLRNISHYGVFITGLMILVGAFILDSIPLFGKLVSFNLFGQVFTLRLYGHVVIFEITSICFILSGYILSFVQETRRNVEYYLSNFLKEFYKRMQDYSSVIIENNMVKWMFFTTLIFSFVQILGNSYYGIYIYETFKYTAFGGFMNVAVIYFIAIFVSFLGPMFASSLKIGQAPLMVFGSLLIAILPLTFAFNPNILAIGIAMMFSVIGSSIMGVSQGLLANELLTQEKRNKYFSCNGFIMTFPMLILIPAGAYAAQFLGLERFFMLIAGILIFIVTPLYFVLVVKSQRLLKWN